MSAVLPDPLKGKGIALCKTGEFVFREFAQPQPLTLEHWFQTAPWALKFSQVGWPSGCLHCWLVWASMPCPRTNVHDCKGGRISGKSKGVRERGVWGCGTLGFLLPGPCMPQSSPWGSTPPTFSFEIPLRSRFPWPSRLQWTISTYHSIPLTHIVTSLHLPLSPLLKQPRYFKTLVLISFAYQLHYFWACLFLFFFPVVSPSLWGICSHVSTSPHFPVCCCGLWACGSGYTEWFSWVCGLWRSQGGTFSYHGCSIAPDICRGEMKFQLCFLCIISQKKQFWWSVGGLEVGEGPWTGHETRVFVPTLTLTLKKSSTLFGLDLKFLNFLLALTF